MKISDRDKKLILFVLLVAIIALPIFLFIRPKNQQIKDMDEELVSLNERYNYLKALQEKQEEYEKQIEILTAKRDEMIKDFAGGVLTENTIMFLKGIELSENPLYSNVITFDEIEEIPVMEASVDANGDYVEAINAYKVPTTINYDAEYNNVKHFLNYIFTYKDKMSISYISMSLDKSTNQITGIVTVDQYAISGNGKEVESVDIPNMKNGTSRLFDNAYDEDGNLLTRDSVLGIKSDNKPADNAEGTEN